MSSQSASHALRCHRSQGRRGRSVSRILRQPPPPVHRGSSTTAPPSKTLLTLSQTLFTLIQKGLTSRGEFLGRPSARCCRPSNQPLTGYAVAGATPAPPRGHHF